MLGDVGIPELLVTGCYAGLPLALIGFVVYCVIHRNWKLMRKVLAPVLAFVLICGGLGLLMQLGSR